MVRRVKESRLSEEERDNDPRSAGARSTREDIQDSEVPGRMARDEVVVEDRELTDDERVALFQASIIQSVLPDLPKQSGYHMCWLSTTNPRDTVENRLRLGYQLIHKDQLRGWRGASVKSGEFAGVVSINEMVAARIPLSLYNSYMRIVHHDAPLDEEQKIKSTVESLQQTGEEANAPIRELGDGTAAIVQKARPMPELRD